MPASFEAKPPAPDAPPQNTVIFAAARLVTVTVFASVTRSREHAPKSTSCVSSSTAHSGSGSKHAPNVSAAVADAARAATSSSSNGARSRRAGGWPGLSSDAAHAAR